MADPSALIEAIAVYDKAIQAAYTTVRGGKIYKKVFDDPKYEYLFPFLNKRLFASLSIVDLLIGLKHINQSQALGNTLEANYFARIIALNAHEILNDLPSLSNNRIRQAIIEQIGEAGISEIDGLIQSINGLKKAHLLELKKIRNNVVGHKLAEALEQSDIIHQLDSKKIYMIGDSIVKILIKLVGSYTTVLEKLATPQM